MHVPLLFIAGLALLWLGLRGRRLDDHPVCAGCGYDLVGVVNVAADSQTNQPCPECASDISRPGRVRIGNRRRLPALIVGGGLLTVLSVVIFATAIWLNTAGLNALALEPFWMLRRAALGDGPSAMAAQQELTRRLGDRTLDPPSVQKLIGDALARQRDLAKPWELWGDIFNAGQICGAVSPAQLQAFTDHYVQARVQPRPRVVAGSPLRFDVRTWIRGTSGSAMPGAGMPSALRVELLDISVDGRPLATPARWIYQARRDRSRTWAQFMTGPSGVAVPPEASVEWAPSVVEGIATAGSPYPVVPDAPGHGTLRATVRLTPGTGLRYPAPAGPWALGSPIHQTIELGLNLPIEVLPASSADLRAVTDDAQLDRFAGGLRLDLDSFNPALRYVGTAPAQQRHLAFQVFIERRDSSPLTPTWPGHWTYVGDLAATQDAWGELHSTVCLSPELWEGEVRRYTGGTTRFLLRPSIEVAKRWFTAGEVTVGKDIIIEGKDLSGRP